MTNIFPHFRAVAKYVMFLTRNYQLLQMHNVHKKTSACLTNVRPSPSNDIAKLRQSSERLVMKQTQ